MKIIDIVHNFPDGHTYVSRGMCRVRSFIGPSGTAVLLTDLGDKNDGLSVANAVELIIKSLVDQGKVIGPATFVEHHERPDPENDIFYTVTISATSDPEWKPMRRADALAIFDCLPFELDDRSNLNGRILAEADRARFSRNPFIDSRYTESNQTIKRRLEIIDGMISKSAIQDLVLNRAGEQDIQRFLKTDLSIFGEVYAKPVDEYICFSEFPLADGSVDFAVFTGRSRMDVILIEVKGADFNLLNNNHYKEFNHKINEAAGQIRTRLGHVYRDFLTFRDHVHSLRNRAETGEVICNAFLGPDHRLQVDPNKDINIKTVVIGGRTVNDQEESVKRQDYEARVIPPIRVESWDTWLRRLQRQ